MRSIAAQSVTTNPENPSSPLSTSVMSRLLPCIGWPFQLLNDTITLPTPALIAAT